MPRERLSPEEVARRKKERSRAAWAKMKSGEAYGHFDPKDGIGYGSEEQWRQAAGDDGIALEAPQAAKVKVDADLARLGLTAMPDDLVKLVRAYRMATLKAHPDAVGGSHEAFLALTESYNRLKLKIRTERKPKIRPADVSGSHKTASIFGHSVREINSILGFPPNMDDDAGKVAHSWGFTVDGDECAVWDWKGSQRSKQFSAFGPMDALRKVFGNAVR